jgi:hypothetical protein
MPSNSRELLVSGGVFLPPKRVFRGRRYSTPGGLLPGQRQQFRAGQSHEKRLFGVMGFIPALRDGDSWRDSSSQGYALLALGYSHFLPPGGSAATIWQEGEKATSATNILHGTPCPYREITPRRGEIVIRGRFLAEGRWCKLRFVIPILEPGKCLKQTYTT